MAFLVGVKYLLINRKTYSSYLVNTLNNTLALLWTGILQSICIVRKLVLIDASSPTDGCNRRKWLTTSDKSCRIDEVIVKLIISINNPLRNFIAIFQHAFYMKHQRLFRFLFSSLKVLAVKTTAPGTFSPSAAEKFFSHHATSTLIFSIFLFFVVVISILLVSKCYSI